MINTIGPVGRQRVWILTAEWRDLRRLPALVCHLVQRVLPPLLLILVALIVRNMGFDYRGKRASATWKARWDLAVIIAPSSPRCCGVSR